jgi:hypothetical protein
MTKIIFWLASIIFLSACSESGYRGDSIEGEVIDASDGRPLEGVVVVALWELVSGIHNSQQGILRADEAVTNANGYFNMPAWGPIETAEGRLRTTSPVLVFYRRGYYSLVETNDIYDPDHKPEIWRSEHNGNRFGLTPFEGTLQEYAERTIGMRFLLTGGHEIGDVCYWERIPVFTRAILQLREAFSKQGIYNELPSADSLRRAGECHNPRELLGSNLFACL